VFSAGVPASGLEDRNSTGWEGEQYHTCWSFMKYRMANCFVAGYPGCPGAGP